MSDVHHRFDAWLAADGAVELSRDVALHASGCDRCLERAAAIDGLLRLDVGAAPPPPILDVSGTGSIHAGPIASDRVGAWVAAVGVLALATAIGVANLDLSRAGPAAAEASPTPINEGVLGGAAGPSVTAALPSASESQSATPSSSESEQGASSALPIATPPRTAAPTPDPTRRPTTAPSETPNPTRTPDPTRSQSPTPVPTPSPTMPPPPTPTPTAEPTSVPTPTPIPTPTLPVCEPLTTCPPP